MEQIQNNLTPEAATDEPVLSPNPADQSDFARPLIQDCLAETFPPGTRQPRHDGWTPAAIGSFLEDLAAHGVVEHAARAVGLSASSAYAFRNRRQGRAFARMWDAVLIHRSRARLAAENQACATLGCVSRRLDRNGEVVGEYHYRDNRLAMAMLTRLDRLAEREAPNDGHLRALSEDLDEFIACAAGGGDLDAFVEARRPPEPEPAPEPRPARPPDSDPDLTRLALLAGTPSYRDVHPMDIPVLDLDPTDMGNWGMDGWIRAIRSGFMDWLEFRQTRDPDVPPGRGAPLHYHFACLGVTAAAEGGAVDPDEPGRQGQAREIDTADLDPARIEEWSDDQLARAHRSHLLANLPDDFWDDLADAMKSPASEE
jgi:hypothetical protein